MAHCQYTKARVCRGLQAAGNGLSCWTLDKLGITVPLSDSCFVSCICVSNSSDNVCLDRDDTCR